MCVMRVDFEFGQVLNGKPYKFSVTHHESIASHPNLHTALPLTAYCPLVMKVRIDPSINTIRGLCPTLKYASSVVLVILITLMTVKNA